MKRKLCVILTLLLCLSLAACAAKTTETGSHAAAPAPTSSAEVTLKPYKIAVLEYTANDETANRRDYYENYLAPYYHVEFMFSEPTASIEGEISFLENAILAGANAYIAFRAEDAPQIAQICQENNIPYVINSNRNANCDGAFTGGFTVFAGAFTGNQPMVGAHFKTWLEENASSDGSEGFMITSGLAFNGNIQHIEITTAALKVLQERYNIRYEDSIENLVRSSAPIEVANDKGINIYLYPGSTGNETWLPGVSAALQTGRYGILMHAAPGFGNTAVVVDEVESTYHKNIKVASIASIGPTLTNAFHITDSFGNTAIDMGITKSNSIISACAFIKIYNALTGYGALNMADNGEAGILEFPFWAVTTVEQVDDISRWDVTGGSNWVVDTDTINECLGVFKPSLTAEAVQTVISGITYEDVKARLN